MNISAQQVKELRERPALPMMDCRKALEEAKGNIEEAIIVLRKKASTGCKRLARHQEGAVTSYIHAGGRSACSWK